LTLKDLVHNEIIKLIEKDVVIERPKDKSLGHFATPVAFSLAKEYRKAPKMIAEELATKLNESEIFESVTAVNGFINLKLSKKFMNSVVNHALKDEDSFGKENNSNKQKILLEYVSANPTGPLHIGHARGAIVGDAIFKIAKHLGYDIDSEYYINDAGNQIHLLGLSLYLTGQESILGNSVEWPEQYYKGEYILDLANEICDEQGKDIFSKEENIEQLALIGKDKMMDLIKDNLASVGIEFDYFVSEKSLYTNWEATKSNLESNGALYMQDDKEWLRSTDHGDEKDRVVVRENGIPTYLAGDIIYHEDKYKRGYDKYINIWGADHHGYIKRVKSAISHLGYNAENLEIILAQMVALLKNGEPYKMSKRAGNFILMSDVVSEIGNDALRYVFLSKKSDTHLEFDVEEIKKQDSTNPSYYINYAHARVNSLFEKAEKSVSDVIDVEFSNLSDEADDLLFDALLLPQVLEDAFVSRTPVKVTDYLYDLASSCHKVYNNNKVVGSENQDELLKLFAMVALSIRVGFKLLGITAKDKM
jgi:arginyl-tRNA synthetase